MTGLHLEGSIFFLSNNLLVIWKVFLLGCNISRFNKNAPFSQWSTQLCFLQNISHSLINHSSHLLCTGCLMSFFSFQAKQVHHVPVNLLQMESIEQTKMNALGVSEWFTALHESDPKCDFPKAECKPTPLSLERLAFLILFSKSLVHVHVYMNIINLRCLTHSRSSFMVKCCNYIFLCVCRDTMQACDFQVI